MAKISPWLMHDLTGIDHDIPLAKIDEIDKSTLVDWQEQRIQWMDGMWPAELSAKDMKLGRMYDFDPVEAVEPGDNIPFFIQFGQRMNEDRYTDEIKRLVPGLADIRIDIQSFSTWFAQQHTDNQERCRAQLNIAISNPAGHRILSIGKDKKHILFTPKEGDVFLLDTRRQHAVIPNQSKGVDYMRNNPLQVIFATVEDRQTDY